MLVFSPLRFSFANSKCRQQMLFAVVAIASGASKGDRTLIRQQTLDKNTFLPLIADNGRSLFSSDDWKRSLVMILINKLSLHNHVV